MRPLHHRPRIMCGVGSRIRDDRGGDALKQKKRCHTVKACVGPAARSTCASRDVKRYVYQGLPRAPQGRSLHMPPVSSFIWPCSTGKLPTGRAGGQEAHVVGRGEGYMACHSAQVAHLLRSNAL